MSSEEADHVSPWEVTPTVGKGTLGTWRFPTSAWVAGLIKPVQSPDAVLETRLWANHGVRVYANQRLSFGEEGKGPRKKARVSNRTGYVASRNMWRPAGNIGWNQRSGGSGRHITIPTKASAKTSSTLGHPASAVSAGLHR